MSQGGQAAAVTEMRSLLAITTKLQEGVENAIALGQGQDGSEFASAFDAVDGYYKDNRKRLEGAAGSLHRHVTSDEQLHVYWVDIAIEVENRLESIEARWPKKKIGQDRLVVELNLVETQLKELRYHCGLGVVPIVLRERIAESPIGRKIKLDDLAKIKSDFTEEEQKRILQYIAGQEGAVDGIVDLKDSSIIALPRKGLRRRIRPLVGLLLLLVGGWIVAHWSGEWWFDITQDDQPARYSVLYSLVLLGAVSHILVDFVKKGGQGSGGSFTVADDWMLWLLVKEVRVYVAVVTIDFVVVALAWFIGDLHNAAISSGAKIGVMSAGYFWDSLADTALKRFEGEIGDVVDAISAKAESK
jgi:hypothetical protein